MKTTSNDIVKMVQDNHIWLDAFYCKNPTDDFLKDIGRMVLQGLDCKERLLPMYLDDEPPGTSAVEPLAEHTPTLYLSINKS